MSRDDRLERVIDLLLEDERVITEGYDLYGLRPVRPEGEYFRANVWSWPAILAVVEEVIREEGLDIDTRGWDENMGAGLQDVEKCRDLAGALEDFLMKHPDKKRFVGHSGRIGHTLTVMHVLGGDIGKTNFEVSRDHLEEFVEFLWTCGGFKIY